MGTMIQKSNLLAMLILWGTCLFSQNQKATLFFTDGLSIAGYAEIKNNKIAFRTSLDEKADQWGPLMVKQLIIEEYGFDVVYEYIKLQPNDKRIELLQLLAKGEVNLYADIKRRYAPQKKLNSNGIGFSSGTSIFNRHGKENGYYNNNYNEKVKYYVKREKEPYPTPLFGIEGFRKKAKTYFSDCPGILEKLKSREFDVNNGAKMVNYYNDLCTD